MPDKTYAIQHHLIAQYLQRTRKKLFLVRGALSLLAIVGLIVLHYAQDLPWEALFIGLGFMVLMLLSVFFTGSANRLKKQKFELSPETITEYRGQKIYRSMRLTEIDHARQSDTGLRLYKKGDRNADGESEHKKKVFIFIPDIVENFSEIKADLSSYTIW